MSESGSELRREAIAALGRLDPQGSRRSVATTIGIVVALVVGVGAWLVLRGPGDSVESLPRARRTAGAPASTVLPRAGGSSSLGSGTAGTAGDAEQAGAPTKSAAPGTPVVVHVAGAVAHPGVVSLPAGSRANDAVAAAGGLVAGADADRINLAAPLVDGERLAVPLIGQPAPAVLPGPTSGGSGTDPMPSAGPVDLNTSSAQQLDTLPGVGPSTAAAIVAYRDEHGPFRSVEGLLDVRGIGDAKLDALRGLVSVSGP